AFRNTFSMIRQITERFSGRSADQAQGIARQAANRVKQAAAEKLMSTMATSAGGTGSPAVVAAVKRVAATYGWGSGAQWEALNWLISKESSWNPQAANPTSSARGLFQKMTSIHGPLEPTIEGQARWGLNYIRSRYQNPLNAKAFHLRN